MLILSRRLGEKVVIGPDITVEVVSIKGSQVKLGFAGPKDVPVYRQEVFDRKQREAAAAAAANACVGDVAPATAVQTGADRAA
ncbi:MAG: carbon storage regulator CsrA [Pseudomonadota bacterium]